MLSFFYVICDKCNGISKQYSEKPHMLSTVSFPVKVKFLQPNVSFAICWKTHNIRYLIQVRRIVLQVVAFHVFAFEILFKHSNSQYTDLLIKNRVQFAET